MTTLSRGPHVWQLRRKPATISISRDVTTVFTFDAEGRPWSCLLDGVHYRRGCDGRVRARGFAEAPRRRWLSEAENVQLLDRVHGALTELLVALPETDTGTGAQTLQTLEHAEGLLQGLLSWDARRLQADADSFRTLYTAVPILPPDRYNALLVQVTRGCAWNRCTFCELYRDRRYEIRSVEALSEHIEALRAYFGAGLTARRHLFLGDANLLSVPPARLLPLLELVRGAFPEPVFREVSAFTDVLGPSRQSDDDLRAMARLGLRHLYFGLESGSDAVRTLLGKAGGAAEAVAAVRRLRNCGLSVGVIVLLGAGGDGLGHDHVEETVRTLHNMRLSSADIVFFSPLRPRGEYEQQAQANGLRALSESEMRQQHESIAAALTPRSSGGPRRALYDVENFVY